MADSMMKLVLLLFFLVVIGIEIHYIKQIIIYHQMSIGLRIVQLLILITFGTMAFFLAETLFDYSVFISAASALLLSTYSKGFTHNGFIPYLIGKAYLIGRKFLFSQTENWIIFEQKKRLKIKCTTLHKGNPRSVYYTYFDKEQKRDILSLIQSNGHSVSVEKQ